jgi:hypothetical protein
MIVNDAGGFEQDFAMIQYQYGHANQGVVITNTLKILTY